MKEINIRLTDDIANYIAKDAKEIGLTSEELVKFIVGAWVQGEMRERKASSAIAIPFNVEGLGESFRKVFDEMKEDAKEHLKKLAGEGAISCKNCTMKIKPEDVDAGKCGACGVPLKQALGYGAGGD